MPLPSACDAPVSTWGQLGGAASSVQRDPVGWPGAASLSGCQLLEALLGYFTASVPFSIDKDSRARLVRA